jgi:acetoin utilization protein AcuC
LINITEGYIVYASDYPRRFYKDFLYRYERVLEILENPSISTLKKHYEIIKPPKITLEDCRIVHEESYLEKLKINCKKDEKFKEALTWDLLGASGSIMACEIAIKERKIVYHLGGGFHHASRDREGAFDYINDIAVAIEMVRKKRGLKRVMVIDLDVHHANGTQNIFYDDPGVLQISFHGWGIFPGTGDIFEIGEKEGKGYKINLPLLANTTNETYLYALERIVPPFIKLYNPQLIIYQAGVDVLVKDPSGNLKLTLEGVYERDRMIKEFTRGYPLAIIRGGGYNNEYSPKANVNTLACFVEQPIIFSYNKKVSEPKKCKKWVEKKLNELKKLLRDYWGDCL